MNDANGHTLKAGDRILLDQQYPGVIVCDFDRREFLPGYEGWDTDQEMLGGGKLDSGVMVLTEAFGLMHYAEKDEDLTLAVPPIQQSAVGPEPT